MIIETITIAIKFDFGWSIDTYTRWLTSKDKYTNKVFIDKFMEDYQGNGIEEVKVLEVGEPIYCHNMVEIEAAIDDIRKNNKLLNETILNY